MSVSRLSKLTNARSILANTPLKSVYLFFLWQAIGSTLSSFCRFPSAVPPGTPGHGRPRVVARNVPAVPTRLPVLPHWPLRVSGGQALVQLHRDSLLQRGGIGPAGTGRYVGHRCGLPVLSGRQGASDLLELPSDPAATVRAVKTLRLTLESREAALTRWSG